MNKKIILTTLSPKSHRTSEENLGLGYLSSVLRQNGYEVNIIDAWLGNLSVDDVYQKIISNNNILFVGISSYMSNTLPTIELITRLKDYNSNIKIVAGGFGPTFYPEDYLNNKADIVIRGEGEEAIVQIANALSNNLSTDNIQGISYKTKDGRINHNPLKPLINNLDQLPFPSRDTLDEVLKKKSTVNVLSARGCSGNCEFCSVIAFFKSHGGKIWRGRSATSIAEELLMLQNNGVKYIKMIDDSFIDGDRDEEWCKAFRDEIKNHHVDMSIRASIRADKVSDKILQYLREAGFYSFACGIENGSEIALKRMNKKATLLQNKKALELFKKYNYLVQMGFILFDKETTIEELEENYYFLKEYDWAITKGIFSEMFSAEGTILTNKLRENGHLIESDFLHNNNKYNLSQTNVKAVYEALKKWHKSHSFTYDMTIDPLSSPKAIPYNNLLDYYEIAMELKHRDLVIFRSILDLSYGHKNIISYVDNQISSNQDAYNKIDEKVKMLNKKNGISYNADINPFI